MANDDTSTNGSSSPSEGPPAESPSHCSRWALIAGMAVIYLVWGSTYLGIKVAIETIPPLLMAGARFLLAGGLLYAYLRSRGATRPTVADWRSAFVLGGLLLLGGNGLVTWAEQYVPSGVAALIITTTPLWMMLVEWLFFHGARPRAAVWAGVVIGFAGVTLLVNPASLFEGSAKIWGVLAIVAAPMVWSIGSLRAKRARHLEPPLMNTALQMLCGGGQMFFLGLALGEWRSLDLAAISLRSWLAFFYLVTFGSLLAFTVYMWLLRVTRPSLVATYAYVNPLVAVLVGAAFGNEPLTPQIGLGAALILGAVALITLRGQLTAIDSEAKTEEALAKPVAHELLRQTVVANGEATTDERLRHEYSRTS